MNLNELLERSRAAAREHAELVKALPDVIVEEANELFAKDSTLLGIGVSDDEDQYYWFGDQSAPYTFYHDNEDGIAIGNGHRGARALFDPLPSDLLLDYFGRDGWALLVTREGLTVFDDERLPHPPIPPGSDTARIMDYVKHNRGSLAR